MDLLPPPGHVPVSVAVIYLIGQILSAETRRTGVEGDLPSFLKQERPPFAIVPPEVPDEDPQEHDTTQRFELTTIGVEIVEARHRSDSLACTQGVRISFTSKNGSPFYQLVHQGSPPRDVRDVIATLRPPYRTCLHPDRVRESVDTGNIHRLPRTAGTALPGAMKRFRLVCPSSMPYAAGLELKQALADEVVAAVVIEEDGTTSDVPPGFWRTPKADVALGQDVLVSVPIEGRLVAGRVFMDAAVIRDGWAQILGLVRPRDPEHLYSPYIMLAIEVSHELGLVNGRDRIGARVSKDVVLREVERLWEKHMDGVTTRLAQRKEFVASMIRHPDDDAGGYVSGKPVKPKGDTAPPKARRQPRPAGSQRRKKA